MLESEVYRQFFNSMKKYVFIQRIENAIHAGTFDCIVCYADTTVWVEFKEDEKQPLRPTQISWAKRRMDHGCTNDMLVITADPRHFIVAMARQLVLEDVPIGKCQRVVVIKKELPEFFLSLFYQIRGAAQNAIGDRQGTESVH
jgi:hypothetical protein